MGKFEELVEKYRQELLSYSKAHVAQNIPGTKPEKEIVSEQNQDLLLEKDMEVVLAVSEDDKAIPEKSNELTMAEDNPSIVVSKDVVFSGEMQDDDLTMSKNSDSVAVLEKGTPSFDTETYGISSMSEDNAEPQVTNGLGFLQLRVFTARGAVPLEGAFVSVSSINNGKELLHRTATTDKNGLSPMFSLPIENGGLPETSNEGERLYSLYNIRTSLNKYISVNNIDVPIFAEETALQNIEMIPMPERYDDAK